MTNSGVPGNNGQLDSFDDLNESVRIAHLGVVTSLVGVVYHSHSTGSGMRRQYVSSLAKVQLIPADPFRYAVTITNHGTQRMTVYVGDESCVLWLAAGTSLELCGPDTPRAALWAIAEQNPAPVTGADESNEELPQPEWDDGWHHAEDAEDAAS